MEQGPRSHLFISCVYYVFKYFLPSTTRQPLSFLLLWRSRYYEMNLGSCPTRVEFGSPWQLYFGMATNIGENECFKFMSRSHRGWKRQEEFKNRNAAHRGEKPLTKKMPENSRKEQAEELTAMLFTASLSPLKYHFLLVYILGLTLILYCLR